MPMTKERRSEIEEVVASPPCQESATLTAEAVNAVAYSMKDLLAEADFWKNAVKNVAEVRIAGEFYVCNLCEERSTEFGKHKPDCAWKLAQE